MFCSIWAFLKDTINSQESKEEETTIFIPLYHFHTYYHFHEYGEIYLQLFIWTVYLVFLIKTCSFQAAYWWDLSEFAINFWLSLNYILFVKFILDFINHWQTCIEYLLSTARLTLNFWSFLSDKKCYCFSYTLSFIFLVL